MVNHKDLLVVEAADGLSFTQLIDADHNYITRLAGKIRRALATLDVESEAFQSSFEITLSLLEDVTWRLIRHDLAEDMVMRPAFVQVLGQTGTEMAEHDRNDHAAARQVLLDLQSDAKRLRSRPDVGGLNDISRKITDAFDTLGEHMKVESGQFLPYFESLVSADVSRDLAGRYAWALLLTPDLRLADGALVVQGGFEEYVHAEVQSLKRLLEDISRRASEDRVLREHLAKTASTEVMILLGSVKSAAPISAEVKPKL